MRPARSMLLCLLLLAVVVCCSMSCSSDGDDPAETGVWITPEAGSVTILGVSLQWPAGAVEEALELSVVKVEDPTRGVTPLGDFYRLGPEDTTFAKPITISMNYDDSRLPEETDAAAIRIYTAADFQSTWSALEGDVDTTALSVSATTDHFSLFGPGLPAEEEDGDQDGDTVTGEPNIGGDTKLAFGLVAIDGQSTRSFTINNSGDGPLQVQSLELSVDSDAAFSLPDKDGSVVQPGYELSFEVTFRPTLQAEATGTVIVASNDTDAADWQIELTGRGAGGGVIAVEPAQLDFGEVEAGTTRQGSLLIKNVNDQSKALAILKAQLIDPSGVFQLQPIAMPTIIQSDDSALLTVSFTPTSAGDYYKTITISSDDLNNPELSVGVGGKALPSTDGDMDAAPDGDLLPDSDTEEELSETAEVDADVETEG